MTKQSIEQSSASTHNGHVTVSGPPHNGHVIGSGSPHNGHVIGSGPPHNGHVIGSSPPHNGHVIGSSPPHNGHKIFRRLKKPRPKTVHRDHRKHRLLLTPSVDTSCDRLEELCKIYGQTLVLNGNMRQLPPKRRFKTVTAPSVKRFSYLEEPITAVETYEENLKQRDCKVTYGRSERHRVGSASPLQWQNIYGDRKKSSIFNPNNRPAPTKFSYNLTRTSY
uniref:Uncharacterized protein n=1 Tax=Ciona savignyi TaxID=51511 RepID=H2Y465_CIOSA